MMPIEASSTPITLSLVASLRAEIGRVAVLPGDVIGEHLGLFPERRDQAVDLPAMLGAFADDVDAGGRRRTASGRRPRCRARRSGRRAARSRCSALMPAAIDDHVAVEARRRPRTQARDAVVAR